MGKKTFLWGSLIAVILVSAGVYVSMRMGVSELRRIQDASQDIQFTLKPDRELQTDEPLVKVYAQCLKENPYRVGDLLKVDFCRCYALNADQLPPMDAADFSRFAAANQALMRSCKDRLLVSK